MTASTLVPWLLLALGPQIPLPVDAAGRSEELRSARSAILDAERSKLSAIGAELPPPDFGADGSSRFLVLPEVAPGSGRGLASVGLAREAAKAARPKGDAIRDEAANALFALATSAASGPSPSFAFADDCLRRVIERKPDHAEARRLLGFVPHEGGWATPYAVEQLRSGKVDDPTFGWVPGGWVPHLARGELPAPGATGKWLPAAEADALRREWSKGWKITTEHFEVQTDLPLSKAISFGRRLEVFYQLFVAMMADVIDADRLPLAQRFKRPDAKPTSMLGRARHKVAYFATRAEYAWFLAPIQGAGASKSLGTYVPKSESKALGGVSYFFDDEGGQLPVVATLYHEVSHQLLFESAGPDRYAQNSGQYWVFEGLGTYFETVEPGPDGSLFVGGLVGPRMEQARIRLIDRGEYVPLRQFVGLDRDEFLGAGGGGDVYRNYAQSMALAVFLMQGRDEADREAFLDYARDAYKGKFRGKAGRPLDDRLGRKPEEVDREFLAYLARMPAPAR